MEHIMLPRFWPEKPALWFAQVEAVFALNKITLDSNKYDFIVSELSNDVIMLVEDIVLNPPENEVDDRYGYLKNKVIERLSILQLGKEEIGSMTPSQFLVHLRDKADTRITDDILKGIWMDGLPSPVRDVMIDEISKDLDFLAKLADKVFEVSPKVQSSNNSGQADIADIAKKINNLSEQMKKLITEVEKLQSVVIENNAFCMMCKIKQRQEVISDENVKSTCWYHSKYGQGAVKCIGPCRYRDNFNSTHEIN